MAILGFNDQPIWSLMTSAVQVIDKNSSSTPPPPPLKSQIIDDKTNDLHLNFSLFHHLRIDSIFCLPAGNILQGCYFCRHPWTK
jgi:hypothetical protein